MKEKNIIAPIHDKDTGYRYYTTWDLHMIIRARCYLKFGFSIDHTAQILQKENLSDIDDILDQQEQIIQKQIIYQINLLKKIQINRSLLKDSRENHHLVIKKSPAMYRINTQKRYTLILSKQEQKEIKTICQHVPFIFSTALFKQENIENQIDEFDFGIGIEEQFAGLFDIKETEFVHFHPSKLCLYMCAILFT